MEWNGIEIKAKRPMVLEVHQDDVKKAYSLDYQSVSGLVLILRLIVNSWSYQKKDLRLSSTLFWKRRGTYLQLELQMGTL